MNETDTDQDLLPRAKDSELAAFEALVSRHERQIYSLARRIVQQDEDVEDVTQQTFLSALEHLDGFREEASFRPGCSGSPRTRLSKCCASARD